MKFKKKVYKCQRCGVLFERKAINEQNNGFSFGKESYYRGHVCGVNERGIGHPVGFNVIDEEAESSCRESLWRKQEDFMRFRLEFFLQIKAVSENAKHNPYWLVIYGKDNEVLGVIGDVNGLPMNLNRPGVIYFLNLPLECIIARSGTVSKICLSPVHGHSPRLDMKAGTYVEYEQQMNEFYFSDIAVKLHAKEVQAGQPEGTRKMKVNKNNEVTFDQFAARLAEQERYLLAVFVKWYKKKNSGPRNRYFYPLKQEELGREIAVNASLIGVWNDCYGEFMGTKEYDKACKRFDKEWEKGTVRYYLITPADEYFT